MTGLGLDGTPCDSLSSLSSIGLLTHKQFASTGKATTKSPTNSMLFSTRSSQSERFPIRSQHFASLPNLNDTSLFDQLYSKVVRNSSDDLVVIANLGAIDQYEYEMRKQAETSSEEMSSQEEQFQFSDLSSDVFEDINPRLPLDRLLSSYFLPTFSNLDSDYEFVNQEMPIYLTAQQMKADLYRAFSLLTNTVNKGLLDPTDVLYDFRVITDSLKENFPVDLVNRYWSLIQQFSTNPGDMGRKNFFRQLKCIHSDSLEFTLFTRSDFELPKNLEEFDTSLPLNSCELVLIRTFFQSHQLCLKSLSLELDHSQVVAMVDRFYPDCQLIQLFEFVLDAQSYLSSILLQYNKTINYENGETVVSISHQSTLRSLYKTFIGHLFWNSSGVSRTLFSHLMHSSLIELLTMYQMDDPRRKSSEDVPPATTTFRLSHANRQKMLDKLVVSFCLSSSISHLDKYNVPLEFNPNGAKYHVWHVYQYAVLLGLTTAVFDPSKSFVDRLLHLQIKGKLCWRKKLFILIVL